MTSRFSRLGGLVIPSHRNVWSAFEHFYGRKLDTRSVVNISSFTHASNRLQSRSEAVESSNRFLCTSTVTFNKQKARHDKTKTILEQSLKLKAKGDKKVINIWKNMSVLQLAEAMDRDLDHLYEVMLFVDDSADYDQPWKCIDNLKVIQEIVKKSGMRSAIVSEPSLSNESHVDRDAVKRPMPKPTELLVPRHPVVTIMGHVDHGKTTLLDSLRHTRVVDDEFGGITQHIGAFKVCLDGSGGTITFLDTPGHAAFTAMRSRGAHVTDIVVLVVAADDGVMEQTKESIRLANEAQVPIIVAINKIDKPEADVERTKKMLLAQGIVLEEAGGDVQTVPISALKSVGLDLLVEAISTQATLLDLKADPRGFVEATVIESRCDPYRGKLSTAIIQRGTLKKGAYLVAGTAWAKVRAMFDDRGKPIQQAAPSTPVEIIGWKELPGAGDEILEVDSEKRAHEVVEYRKSLKLKEKTQEDQVAIQHKIDEHLKEYMPILEKRKKLGRFAYKIRGVRTHTPKEDENVGPKLSVIVKGDVDGSVEAILDVLDSYESHQCSLDLIHYGVGPVTEGDVKLAEPFGAIIYAFNVGVLSPTVRSLAKSGKVLVKEHNIIYRLFDDLKADLEKLLPPTDVEELLGEANVLQEFIVTEGRQKLPVAGCRCVKGNLKKNALFKLVRGEETVYRGKCASMKHLKNEVDTIKKDVECGVRLDDSSVNVKPGDTLICYQLKQVPTTIDWDTGF